MGRGHRMGRARGIYGGYQAILWDDKNKVYGALKAEKMVKLQDIKFILNRTGVL